MNNRELEGKIKSAVEKNTPDVWESVERDIGYGKGDRVTMSDNKRKSKLIGFISGLAAALVLVAAGVFGIVNYNKADEKIVSTVAIEVNPEITLSLNTYNVVLKVNADNEDGKKVLGTMNLNGTQLDVAINAIIGSMVKNGYLTTDANSVLISVENENKTKAKSLNDEILNAVKNNDFRFATVVQTVANTDKLKTEAEKLNITTGKTEFIHSIKENGAKASKEELSKLSVHELNLIFQTHLNTGKKEGTGYKGNAVEGKYIGAQKAKEIVLKDAKVNEKDVRDFEVDFDYDYGKMVYEIEFEVGKTEYDYELDAVSGSIFYSNKTTPKFDISLNSSDTLSTSSQNSSTSKLDAVIAPENALGFALMHAGFEKKDVRDVDVEIDLENVENYHYDVEFKINGFEYEYEIDAISGEVIKNHKEKDD